MKEIKLLSLFSGIGAFEKGFERAGYKVNTVNYCEFDKYASKAYSLIHNVPESMNLGDITKINVAGLEEHCADVITYGFPCQDISTCGKQKGFTDADGNLTRSGLFFYAASIVDKVQPKVAICENVKALTSKKFEKEFGVVLSTLEEMGYKNYWQVLNAKDYGIPQNRERVFVVSVRKDIDKKFTFPTPVKLEMRLKDMLEKEVDEKYYLSEKQTEAINNSTFRQKQKQLQRGDISDTLLARDYKDVKCVQVEPKFKKVVPVNDSYSMLEGGVIGKMHEQSRRVYNTDGVAPTIHTCGGGNQEPKIIEPVCLNSKGGRGGVEGLQPSLQDRVYDSDSIAVAVTPSFQQNYTEPYTVASRGRYTDNGIEQQLEARFDGVTNTITTVQKDNYVCIPQATKKGYIECEVPGVADLSYPNSKTRRGRVQENGTVCPTITAESNGLCKIEPQAGAFRPKDRNYNKHGGKREVQLEIMGGGIAPALMASGVTNEKGLVIEPKEAVICEERKDEGMRFFKNDVCGTLRTIDACGDKRVIEADRIEGQGGRVRQIIGDYRIRKLTPKECWRLMGFEDKDIDICTENNISNTQAYKMAGNSIVVDVVQAIAENLKDIL